MKRSETLHLLVTCCLEQTRFDILKQVVEDVTAKGIGGDDLLVFDNGSTVPGTRELLSRFKHVMIADENYGFWSAIHYALQNYSQLMGAQYPLVYVVESDEIHYAYDKMETCERFMISHPEFGSMRLQEFSVTESWLYDKTRPVPESRRWAWTRLENFFTGQRATFEQVEPSFYATNLSPQVCALNRMDFMLDAFDHLVTLKKLAEVDFQRKYFERYAQTALLDGGMFHAKASFDAEVMTGSHSEAGKMANVGYRSTRFDSIVPVDQMHVRLLNTDTPTS